MRYLLIFLSLIGCANAEPWDKWDTALGGAAVTAIAIDWSQTRWAAKNPCVDGSTTCTDPYYENGIIAKRFIGESPTTGQVDRYFLAYAATTLLVADWLSPPLRKGFLALTTVVQIGYVSHNYRIGVKMALQ